MSPQKPRDSSRSAGTGEAGSGDAGSGDARSDLSREIARALRSLDPWSYWVVPAVDGFAGKVVVVGTTGAFLIAACDLGGYLEAGRGGVTIGGRRLRGFASVRRGARRLRGRLSAANVFAEVTPIVCLTRAVAGAPRTVRGVRVVTIAQLASDVTNGPRVLLPNHAEQAARSIGSLVE